MHDRWPAAGKQRVEAGVPRGAGYVEAGWGDRQKQTTLRHGYCSHCPADICGLRRDRYSMQAKATCALCVCALQSLQHERSFNAIYVCLLQSIQCLHVKCTS